MTAVLSLALSTSEPVAVQAASGHVHITFGTTRITIPSKEVATLAAALLDAIGAKSCEVVDMDNALPPVLERAIRRGDAT
jgi:hypothetical protein